ncbi:MAG: amino acid-binding protein [Magnetococcales bacterium]|nr:amino acid-binding protein [Magnetococcales bacterium]NGZ26303.1 amino acid-binding protein [Magnetococcales bacterium]
MERFALLTLFGRDRPGIVARISRVLYEIGCNIEDSSMTRLRGEFTIMLILRFPVGCQCDRLQAELEETVQEMDLFCHLRELSSEDCRMTSNEENEEGCVIHVMGADKPGIVYRVTRLLQEEGGNVTDLRTQVVGSPQRPLYAMLIEAGLQGSLTSLQEHMSVLAKELGVEISVRSMDLFTL